MKLTTQFHQVCEFRMSGAILPLPHVCGGHSNNLFPLQTECTSFSPDKVKILQINLSAIKASPAVQLPATNCRLPSFTKSYKKVLRTVKSRLVSTHLFLPNIWLVRMYHSLEHTKQCNGKHWHTSALCHCSGATKFNVLFPYLVNSLWNSATYEINTMPVV
jgi:hypothetical protein